MTNELSKTTSLLHYANFEYVIKFIIWYETLIQVMFHFLIEI